MAFKYGMKLQGEQGLSFNAVVFATREEADFGGRELLSRWFTPTGYEVVETNGPVNYRVTADRIQRIEEAK